MILADLFFRDAGAHFRGVVFFAPLPPFESTLLPRLVSVAATLPLGVCEASSLVFALVLLGESE